MLGPFFLGAAPPQIQSLSAPTVGRLENKTILVLNHLFDILLFQLQGEGNEFSNGFELSGVQEFLRQRVMKESQQRFDG